MSRDDADGTDESAEESVDGPAAGDTGGGIGALVTRFRQRSRKQQILRAGTAVTVLGFVVLVAVVPTGILGLVVTDSTSFAASPAAPADSTLNETAFEQTSADTVVVERTVRPAGQERTIVVQNKRRTYTETIEVQNGTFDAGVFVTLSSPTITVAGSEQNPLADMSHRELLQQFQSDLDAGDGNVTFRRVGERQAAMLGQRTTVSEFRTNLSVDGEQREFAVYVTKVRSEGDIVVAVGLHPVAFADEQVSLMRLMYAVEHPSG